MIQPFLLYYYFYMIVGTLPLFAILGIKDWIESLSSNLYVVGGALIVTGCLLFASDRVRKGRKNEHSARMTDVLIVGAAQALATCPGLSRSGTTISVGCFLGFERKFAVRYSFIMSIPAVLGANILSLKDALEGEVIWKDVPVYLLGVLARTMDRSITAKPHSVQLRYLLSGQDGVFIRHGWERYAGRLYDRAAMIFSMAA